MQPGQLASCNGSGKESLYRITNLGLSASRGYGYLHDNGFVISYDRWSVRGSIDCLLRMWYMRGGIALFSGLSLMD